MKDKYNVLFWLTIIFAGLLYIWGIWSIPLLSHNEARRLVVLREMIASHQWFTPMKNGEFYFEKPPLFYWTGVPFSLLFSHTAEWMLRLPSALAALFATGLLYTRIRTYIGLQPAIFSALILVSSPFYIRSARLAEINVFFGMLCFSALIFYYDFLQRRKKKYLYFSFFTLGLAFLTKGPVALIFFFPPLLVYALLQRDLGILRGCGSPLGWMLFAVVGISWFAYALYGIPDSPLQAVVRKDIVVKVYKNTSYDPFYSYFLVVLGSFAPWVLILFYHPRRWVTQLTDAKKQFLVCSFAVPLIILSFFATKHDKYILPVFPFLAAFLGCIVSDVYNNFSQRRGQRFRIIFNWLAGGLLVVLFAVLVLAPPYTLTYRFASLVPFADKIRSLKGENQVFAYNNEPIELIYYYGKPITVLDKNQLEEKLGREQSFLLVVEQRGERKMFNEKEMCLLGEFAPYLKKNRKGLLYGSHNFCKNFSQTSLEPL